MQTLFISPPLILINVLKNLNKEFIFCDQDYNFYIYRGEKLIEKFILDDVEIYFLGKSKIENLLNLLDSYSPIFSRWLHKAHQHEYLKEKYIFRIQRLINVIKKYNLKRGLFLTASSHHLDNYCFELALRILNLDQIFLYPIFSRLIPFKQNNGVETRKRLNLEISNFKFNKLITEISRKNKVWIPHSKFQKFYNYIKSNFYLSFLYLIVRKLKRIFIYSIKCFKYNLFVQKDNIFFKETSSSDFELLINQKNFLDKYKRESVDFNFKNRPKISLLIAAHYQPEATSFPESGRIYSHLFIISHLRNIGISDEIFYKEHPASRYFIEGGETKKFITAPSRVGINRNLGYIEELKRMNCILLPFNSDILKFKNILPVTLCGSIAIERSLCGLHTIYTGHPWWEGLPGTINLYNNPYDLNNIPLELITPKIDLALEAKKFFLENFNYKTINNSFSIGIIEKNNKVNKEFDNEIKLFINQIGV